MTDDELLASAFRKILTTENYHYIGWNTGPDSICFDSSWDHRDGLTEDEFDAIFRTLGFER